MFRHSRNTDSKPNNALPEPDEAGLSTSEGSRETDMFRSSIDSLLSCVRMEQPKSPPQEIVAAAGLIVEKLRQDPATPSDIREVFASITVALHDAGDSVERSSEWVAIRPDHLLGLASVAGSLNGNAFKVMDDALPKTIFAMGGDPSKEDFDLIASIARDAENCQVKVLHSELPRVLYALRGTGSISHSKLEKLAELVRLEKDNAGNALYELGSKLGKIPFSSFATVYAILANKAVANALKAAQAKAEIKS